MKPAGGQRPSLRRRHRNAIVVAHRGASAHVPENTVPAFQAAWDAGAEWVEADTQPAADGIPMILHDADLDRTTSGTGPIRSQPAAELARHRIRGLPGARIPELAAVLDLLAPPRKLLLEIKGEHTVAEVDAVLGATGGNDRVLLQSFEVDVLRTLRANDPALPSGLLVERLDRDPLAVTAELGAVAYNPDYREVLRRPELVAELRPAGIAVAVWTSDDPQEWELLTAAGVDAIITNRPAELLAWQQGCADCPVSTPTRGGGGAASWRRGGRRSPSPPP